MVKLSEFYQKSEDSKIKVLNLVLKSDTQGTLEAIQSALLKLETEEFQIRIIHAATGEITESDIETIMNYAAQFRERIGDGSYDDKRDLMELLEVKAKLHLGERWIHLECSIPGLERKIMLHRSKSIILGL